MAPPMRRSSSKATVVSRLALAAAVLLLTACGGNGAAAFNYADALDKALLFFEAQRSGKLPAGQQRVTWRGDSGLSDGSAAGVDLAGGYYDAGDNVKFGLPMAFTVTMLSWSLLEYGADVADAGELAHALESIKWGTDYFIKAHTRPDELWAEVRTIELNYYSLHAIDSNKLVNNHLIASSWTSKLC